VEISKNNFWNKKWGKLIMDDLEFLLGVPWGLIFKQIKTPVMQLWGFLLIIKQITKASN